MKLQRKRRKGHQLQIKEREEGRGGDEGRRYVWVSCVRSPALVVMKTKLVIAEGLSVAFACVILNGMLM